MNRSMKNCYQLNNGSSDLSKMFHYNLSHQTVLNTSAVPLQSKRDSEILNCSEGTLQKNNAFKAKKIEILKKKLQMQKLQLDFWKSQQQKLSQQNLQFKLNLARTSCQNQKVKSTTQDQQQENEISPNIFSEEKAKMAIFKSNNNQKQYNQKNNTIILNVDDRQYKENFNPNSQRSQQLKKTSKLNKSTPQIEHNSLKEQNFVLKRKNLSFLKNQCQIPAKIIKELFCDVCKKKMCPNQYFSHGHSIQRQESKNGHGRSQSKLSVQDLF